MANTLKFGNGQWATGNGTALAYNDENANFKPLPFDFTRASSGTTVNQSGLIETVGSGIPRIDFQGNTKGALLLEPSRTNYILLSNDFSSISGNGYVTSNYGVSPEGLSVSRVLFTGANQILGASTSLATGVVCNFSAYVKGVKGEFIKFAAGGQDLFHTFSGEWERLSGSTTSINSSWNLNTFGGATARDFQLCGVQLELGSYATSYIPTSGSAVTRVADVCNNGANEQVIGQTEGVFYVDLKKGFTPSAFEYISLSDGTTSNTIRIFFNTSNQIGIVVGDGGVTQVNSTYSNVYLESENLKVAFKYKQNDFALWVNGQEVITDNSGTVPNVNYLNFGRGDTSTTWYEKTKEIKLYNTALTDAQLQALTT